MNQTTTSGGPEAKSQPAPAGGSNLFSEEERAFSFYDDLRLSPTASFRPVRQPKPSPGRALHVATDPERLGESRDVTLCHVPIFLRYSMYDEQAGTFHDVSWESYGGTAGALLAMHHFNNGDGSIVKELAGINERCNIRFTTEVVDTESSPIVAVQRLTSIISNRQETDIKQPRACAVMGAAWYTVSRSMATVTGVYDLLQVSPSSSSMSLDSMTQYPLFSRTHASDEAKGELAVEYFDNVLGIKLFGILFVNSDVGISLQKTIMDAAAKRNMKVRSVTFEADSNAASLRNSLLQLREFGFNYFLGVFFPFSYDYVMEIAADVGMAGPGKFWLLTGHKAEVFASGNTTVKTGSSAAIGSAGLGILHDDGAPGLPHYDLFLNQWKAIQDNKESLDYINSKQPPPPKGTNMTFKRSSDYFGMRPSHYSQYSYDAIAGLGIAACRAADQSKLPDNYFTGKQHHEVFLSRSFRGATGNVVFGNHSFSRDGSTVNYFMSDILEIDRPAQHTSIFSGTTSVYFDTSQRRWKPYPGAPKFVYSDNSTVPPAELPAYTEEKHGLTSPVQAMCLLLAAIVMMSSIGLSVFVLEHEEKKVIRASQPPFLYILCLGTFVMSSAIIPLMIDDSISDEAGCSVACMSMVWLASIGFTITFSALFSKTWRINKLVSMSRECQRVTVTPRDVIVPFLALFLSNVLILSLWTAFDPLQWYRKALQYDQFGRQVESVGLCYSEGWLPYGIALFVVNGIALFLAMFEAYKGRHMTSEFAESKYIAMAMICIFQASFVGLPLFFLTKEWPTAHTFVLATMIFITCMSVLLLIFVPKILIMRKRASDSTRVSNITTIHHANISGENRSRASIVYIGNGTPPRAPNIVQGASLRASESFDYPNADILNQVIISGANRSRASFVQFANGPTPQRQSSFDNPNDIFSQELAQANQQIRLLQQEIKELKRSKPEEKHADDAGATGQRDSFVREGRGTPLRALSMGFLDTRRSLNHLNSDSLQQDKRWAGQQMQPIQQEVDELKQPEHEVQHSGNTDDASDAV